MIYYTYEAQRRLLKPYAYYLKNMINMTEGVENILNQYNPLKNILNEDTPKNTMLNFLQAKNKFIYQFVKDYPKPDFNFIELTKEELRYQITEDVVIDKTFCELRKFIKTPGLEKKVPLLIVAPLSGHYATLLKDTVKSSLYEFDVFITDWKNCRDIPIEEGDFGFDDYVLYVEEFISYVKKEYGEVNILAVCQPTVPVLAAIAKMAEQKSQYQADKVVLMGGPIDTRKSPTEVNKYAENHDINWFKSNVIHPVPLFYKGVNREVYPGFLQYSGFVAMNFQKHNQANLDFFNNLLKGADLDAKKHEAFYEEYNAVMDLPAKYYLETIENVFIDQKLAKGTLIVNGVPIDLSKIKNTKIFTIEGELDDISGPGQTHAAIELCSGLSKEDKKSITFDGVGHYGIFSGSKWRKIVYPKIKNFIINN